MHWIREREPQSVLVLWGWTVVTDAAGANGVQCKMPWGQLQLSPHVGLNDIYLCNQREGPAWHPEQETSDTMLGINENSHFSFSHAQGPRKPPAMQRSGPSRLVFSSFCNLKIRCCSEYNKCRIRFAGALPSACIWLLCQFCA